MLCEYVFVCKWQKYQVYHAIFSYFFYFEKEIHMQIMLLLCGLVWYVCVYVCVYLYFFFVIMGKTSCLGAKKALYLSTTPHPNAKSNKQTQKKNESSHNFYFIYHIWDGILLCNICNHLEFKPKIYYFGN